MGLEVGAGGGRGGERGGREREGGGEGGGGRGGGSGGNSLVEEAGEGTEVVRLCLLGDILAERGEGGKEGGRERVREGRVRMC